MSYELRLPTELQERVVDALFVVEGTHRTITRSARHSRKTLLGLSLVRPWSAVARAALVHRLHLLTRHEAEYWLSRPRRTVADLLITADTALSEQELAHWMVERWLIVVDPPIADAGWNPPLAFAAALRLAGGASLAWMAGQSLDGRVYEAIRSFDQHSRLMLSVSDPSRISYVDSYLPHVSALRELTVLRSDRNDALTYVPAYTVSGMSAVPCQLQRIDFVGLPVSDVIRRTFGLFEAWHAPLQSWPALVHVRIDAREATYIADTYRWRVGTERTETLDDAARMLARLLIALPALERVEVLIRCAAACSPFIRVPGVAPTSGPTPLRAPVVCATCEWPRASEAEAECTACLALAEKLRADQDAQRRADAADERGSADVHTGGDDDEEISCLRCSRPLRSVFSRCERCEGIDGGRSNAADARGKHARPSTPPPRVYECAPNDLLVGIASMLAELAPLSDASNPPRLIDLLVHYAGLHPCSERTMLEFADAVIDAARPHRITLAVHRTRI